MFIFLTTLLVLPASIVVVTPEYYDFALCCKNSQKVANILEQNQEWFEWIMQMKRKERCDHLDEFEGYIRLVCSRQIYMGKKEGTECSEIVSVEQIELNPPFEENNRCNWNTKFMRAVYNYAQMANKFAESPNVETLKNKIKVIDDNKESKHPREKLPISKPTINQESHGADKVGIENAMCKECGNNFVNIVEEHNKKLNDILDGKGDTVLCANIQIVQDVMGKLRRQLCAVCVKPTLQRIQSKFSNMTECERNVALGAELLDLAAEYYTAKMEAMMNIRNKYRTYKNRLQHEGKII